MSPIVATVVSRFSIRTAISSPHGINSASRVRIFVGSDDTLYVGAAFRDESTRRNDAARPQPSELRGIVVGNAIDGSLRAFIPDPTDLKTVDRGTSASGIAADGMGNIYAADVGAHKLRKYVRLR